MGLTKKSIGILSKCMSKLNAIPLFLFDYFYGNGVL